MAQIESKEVLVGPAALKRGAQTAAEPDVATGLSSRTRRALVNTAIYVFMTALCLVFLIPLAWMISTSLKARGFVFLWPPQFIPSPIAWDNYSRVFELVPFGRYIWNTLVIMFWCILGTVISCSLVAYGFARLRFPGRNFLFGVLIASMMIPGTVLMIPNFVMFKLLGWYNTILPLTVPAFFGAPFFIFLMRQYMLTLPLELDDAARIDGASRMQVFTQIIMPLCHPPIAIMVVFTFMGVWGDLMGPLIYLSDTEKYTVAVGLAMFQNMSLFGGTDWGAMMAASVMSVLPCIVIYYFAQDKLIGGIASVGLKG